MKTSKSQRFGCLCTWNGFIEYLPNYFMLQNDKTCFSATTKKRAPTKPHQKQKLVTVRMSFAIRSVFVCIWIVYYFYLLLENDLYNRPLKWTNHPSSSIHNRISWQMKNDNHTKYFHELSLCFSVKWKICTMPTIANSEWKWCLTWKLIVGVDSFGAKLKFALKSWCSHLRMNSYHSIGRLLSIIICLVMVFILFISSVFPYTKSHRQLPTLRVTKTREKKTMHNNHFHGQRHRMKLIRFWMSDNFNFGLI